MRVRWIGLALALALVAGAVGHRLGTERPAAPVTFAADPVPASGPSSPVIPTVVLPDNPAPALEPGVPVRRRTVGSPPFDVSLPVPRGWIRSDSSGGEWKWYPSPELMENVYFIRVRQVGNNYRPIESAVRTRISDLDGAVGVSDLHVTKQQDRFVASYVSGGYRRLSYEGFLARDDSGVADVYIAVVGRRVDRAGLQDLFGRLMTGTRA